MAEQLALDQPRGDGGAAQHHERAIASRAVVVDRLRDQALAGAALALDEDRGAGRGRVAHLLDARAASRASVRPGDRARSVRRGAPPIRSMRAARRRCSRPRWSAASSRWQVQGPGLHVVRPVPHRLDGRGGERVFGDQHRAGLRIALERARQQRAAVDARRAQRTYQAGDPSGVEGVQRALTVSGPHHVDTRSHAAARSGCSWRRSRAPRRGRWRGLST